MNKLIPLLAFSALLLVPVSQNAYAGDPGTCESVQDGPWENGNTWSNFCTGPAGIPSQSQTARVLHDVTISTDIVKGGIIAVDQPNGILTVKIGASLTGTSLQARSDFFNHGTTTLNNWTNFGFDTFHNECTGVLTQGQGINEPGALFINHGIINIIGDESFNMIFNRGIFQNSGTINPFEKLITQQQGVFETIPSKCTVGGESIPIDTTSLILAGAQSFSWMIPVVLSGIGIGLFVVTRKSE